MIPIFSLEKQNKLIGKEINDAIQEVINSNQFILGDQLNHFEHEFSDYCGSSFGIGVGSGTEAIQIALMAAGVNYGDEVITVPNTAVFTVLAISSVGAKPVFVDINSNDYTIDISKIEDAITKKTKAIIPVHLYGQCADMDEIINIANNYNLKIIEDACQAHGAEYKGIKSGSLGDIGCFSFYPSKNLGSFGDAGMIITRNEELTEKMRWLRNGGQENRYSHKIKGINSRLDEIQAAILRIKLQYLDKWNNQRIKIANMYNNLINTDKVFMPIEVKFRKHVYHLFVIRTHKRELLQKHLEFNKIGNCIHYPLPVFSHDAYEDLNINTNKFPVTALYSKEILSLPMFPELTEREVHFVANCINGFDT